MNDEKRPTNRLNDERRGLPLREGNVPESELLINRIIDGEASSADQARFEQIADTEPAYWKTLALRQRDMATLTHAVDGRTQRAMHVGVQTDRSVERPRRLPYVGWALTATGWAAVLVLAALWGVTVLHNQDQQHQLQPVLSHQPDMSPQQHLDAYLRAPNVLWQALPERPVAEQMSDGRWAMRFKRQIHEVRIYDTKEALVRDWDHLPNVVPQRSATGASEEVSQTESSSDSSTTP